MNLKECVISLGLNPCME